MNRMGYKLISWSCSHYNVTDFQHEFLTYYRYRLVQYKYFILPCDMISWQITRVGLDQEKGHRLWIFRGRKNFSKLKSFYLFVMLLAHLHSTKYENMPLYYVSETSLYLLCMFCQIYMKIPES